MKLPFVMISLVLPLCHIWSCHSPAPDLEEEAGRDNHPKVTVETKAGERFQWRLSTVLELQPIEATEGEHFYSHQDVSLIKHSGDWHLFCTRRADRPSFSIEYLKIRNWQDKNPISGRILPFSGHEVSSPQVFFFRPQRLWYLIFQTRLSSTNQSVYPVYSTSSEIGDVKGWSRPRPLRVPFTELSHRWSDFWVICDQSNPYLFATTADGEIFRSRTNFADFPSGWSKPEIALKGDFIEAGQVYRIQDSENFLTIVVASRYLRRYYKAYISNRLDGGWDRLAVSRTEAFLSSVNVDFRSEPWADSFGPGELLRLSPNEDMPISIETLKILLPAVKEREMHGKYFREVPWRMALFELSSYPSGLE
jgi:hypothetical protein